MNCRRHTHGQEPIDSLEAVVGDYISKYRDGASRELRFYTFNQSLSVPKKIEILSFLPGVNRHNHKRKFLGSSFIEETFGFNVSLKLFRNVIRLPSFINS